MTKFEKLVIELAKEYDAALQRANREAALAVTLAQELANYDAGLFHSELVFDELSNKWVKRA